MTGPHTFVASCEPRGDHREPDPLADALRRAEAERRAAPGLSAELMALPPQARLAALRRDPRFATLGLALDLLTSTAAPGSPEGDAEGARLALAVTRRLAPGRYPRGLISDVRGRAWAIIAGARVRESDLAGAAKALARAVAALQDGTGDPLEEAHLLEQAAALLRRQGRRFAARRLERKARKLYLEIGEVDAAAALERASGLLPGGSSFTRRGSVRPSHGLRRGLFPHPHREDWW